MTYLPSQLKEFEGRVVTRVLLDDTFPIHHYHNTLNIDILNSIKDTGLINPLVGFKVPEVKLKWNGDHRARHDKMEQRFRNDTREYELFKRPYHLVSGCQRWHVLYELGVTETDVLLYDVKSEVEQLRHAELTLGKSKY